ncbi:hypothetical protein A0H81_09622 [Grifola frondosa]|uniref:Uncharacterized protein n=1 Tax=Grifola frondosa TaxID=5627 RepID=A0A1C7M0T2_GRIFR|nr:hypothetical protein A0H81_09622 [Grifola frondosa]
MCAGLRVVPRLSPPSRVLPYIGGYQTKSFCINAYAHDSSSVQYSGPSALVDVTDAGLTPCVTASVNCQPSNGVPPNGHLNSAAGQGCATTMVS